MIDLVQITIHRPKVQFHSVNLMFNHRKLAWADSFFRKWWDFIQYISVTNCLNNDCHVMHFKLSSILFIEWIIAATFDIPQINVAHRFMFVYVVLLLTIYKYTFKESSMKCMHNAHTTHTHQFKSNWSSKLLCTKCE